MGDKMKLQEITKTLDGKKVLDALSLSIPPKGILAIIGRSGIGKTTLLRIIAGLEKPDKGSITDAEIRVAYKFQEPRLLPWLTALDNISAVIDGADAKEKAQIYLEKVGLSDAALLFPHQLSGGMAQRVALARALAYEANLLLLDEPFSAVDENTKDSLLSLVKQYGTNHAVVIVTHTPEEIAALDASTFTLAEPNQN